MMKNVLLIFLILNSLLFSCETQKKASVEKKTCNLVDHDGSFDDLRSIIYLSCLGKVSHLVFTEGVSRPQQSFYNAIFLAKQHKLKGIEKFSYRGSETKKNINHFWKKTRKRDERLNNYFKSHKKPHYHNGLKTLDSLINDINGRCEKVNLLVLGPLSSTMNYYNKIKVPIIRSVFMGRFLKKDFNCWYDYPSCEKAFNAIKTINHGSFHVPNIDLNGQYFSYDQSFVDSLNHDDIWKRIFNADHSGWKKSDILMWDDLTSIYFTKPELFNSKDKTPLYSVDKYQQEWKNVIQSCSKSSFF